MTELKLRFLWFSIRFLEAIIDFTLWSLEPLIGLTKKLDRAFLKEVGCEDEDFDPLGLL